MAKYWITYSCGHEVETQLFGPMKERERKIQWCHEVGLCPACYKAHKGAEHEREVSIATEKYQLVSFNGTPRQRHWANDLRFEIVQRVEFAIEHIDRNFKSPILKAKSEEVLRTMINGKPDCKWWIDNRHSLPLIFEREWAHLIKSTGIADLAQELKSAK